MNNSDMKKNRYAQWARARKKLAWVNEQFAAGRDVYVLTHTKATRYTAKHAGMFTARKNGFYVQSGKKYVCLDFTQLRAQ